MNYRKQRRIIPFYAAEYKVVDKMLIDVDKGIEAIAYRQGSDLNDHSSFPVAFGFHHVLLDILENDVR